MGEGVADVFISAGANKETEKRIKNHRDVAATDFSSGSTEIQVLHCSTHACVEDYTLVIKEENDMHASSSDGSPPQRFFDEDDGFKTRSRSYLLKHWCLSETPRRDRSIHLPLHTKRKG